MASTRAHLFRPVTDSEGNVVPNTTVTVYERGSTQKLQQPMFATPNGSGLLDNPFTTSSGIIDFYLAAPQDVAIGLSVRAQGGVEQRIEDVGVLPPTDQLVRSPQGFQIVNDPDPGKYLQASVDRKAYWVTADEVMASRPTPTVAVREYDFSASYLDDLHITGSSEFVDTSIDLKPQGYGFLQGLAFTSKVTVPSQLFPERGRVIFAYKVLPPASVDGSGAARMRVSLDDHAAWTLTPVTAEFVGLWRIGYLEIMDPGSHTVAFEQVAGTDPASQVLLGPITLQYGNNIPPHDHAGEFARSTQLGTDAQVLDERATALGDHAQATKNATAVGADTEAFASGTAVGSGAWAAQDSVAVGYRAGGASGTTNWVSLGSQSTTSGDSAVAVGYDTFADGDNSLAMGAEATAAGEEAVALGSGASATGYRALAIGTGAAADHDYSVAIGPGVETQAAHEARLGDAETVVVVPGSLRHTGARAVLGAPDTKLGFYGAEPIARPVVLGSRNGNQVLTQLLAALDGMGIVDDRSTT